LTELGYAQRSRRGKSKEPSQGSCLIVRRSIFGNGIARLDVVGYRVEMPDRGPRSALPHEAMEHLDALYDHGRYLTRNEADAEDLVQETYARAFGAATSFAGGNLKAWLFRIQRNAFIDMRRRRSSQPATADWDLDTVADPASGDGGPPGGEQLAQLRRVTGAEIEAALFGLSDEARAIVLLDIEGFTETEMADILGCALGTVKSRLSRARAALREKLKDYAR
jgi:RNA polymerase sigma-70 factor (ECF subfamily)